MLRCLNENIFDLMNENSLLELELDFQIGPLSSTIDFFRNFVFDIFFSSFFFFHILEAL